MAGAVDAAYANAENAIKNQIKDIQGWQTSANELIQKNYDTSVGTLTKTRDQGNAAAYLDSIKNEKALLKTLGRSGIRGGADSTAQMDIKKTKMAANASNNATFTSGLTQLNQNYANAQLQNNQLYGGYLNDANNALAQLGIQRAQAANSGGGGRYSSGGSNPTRKPGEMWKSGYDYSNRPSTPGYADSGNVPDTSAYWKPNAYAYNQTHPGWRNN